jgi:deoxyribodipyrimidine photo-lyase
MLARRLLTIQNSFTRHTLAAMTGITAAQGTLDKFNFTNSSPAKAKPAATNAKKRAASTTADGPKPAKQARTGPSGEAKRLYGAANAKGNLGYKETAEELAEEGETPFEHLNRVMSEGAKTFAEVEKATGEAVVYWCRMKDLRIEDNRALALASAKARELGKHLVVIHILSPGDYRSHDRSDKRIDFVLRVRDTFL